MTEEPRFFILLRIQFRLGTSLLLQKPIHRLYKGPVRRTKRCLPVSIMSPTTIENDGSERSLTRSLRIVCVLTFIPAIAFNIAHGIIFEAALPALGLIPHALSTCLAMYEL